MLLSILPFYSQYLEPANVYLINNIVQNFPFITIILSLLTGIFTAATHSKTAMKLCFFNLIVCFCMSLATLVYCVTHGGYYIYMMGHFPAPFGNEIRVGTLETLMATAFSLVMLLSLMGGLKHIFHDVLVEKQEYYFLMMDLLFTSLLALIYTNDLFTAYVFVEINTLTACAIVMLKHSKETLVATSRYLMMSLLGSGLIMIGISILYDITGHLLMEDIKQAVQVLVTTGQYKFPLEVVVCLFAIGIGIKSALYPFHSWLPDAHGTSTSASSAVLSGLVLKAYIILLIKMVYRVFGLDVIINSTRVLDILFVLGVLAMTIGSIKAINSRDLKRMIAYSSVAQIGYIYMGIGLGNTAGMVAACFQILVHAYTKPMLFNTAGAFMDTANGSRKFKDLVGAARKNMWAGIGFAVGAFSMIGIPLFAGFVVKYNLALSAIPTNRAVIALIALVISTVLNAIYYVPAIIVLFKKTDKTKNIVFFGDKKDGAFIVSNGVFIICNFILGIFSTIFITFIAMGLQNFA